MSNVNYDWINLQSSIRHPDINAIVSSRVSYIVSDVLFAVPIGTERKITLQQGCCQILNLTCTNLTKSFVNFYVDGEYYASSCSGSAIYLTRGDANAEKNFSCRSSEANIKTCGSTTGGSQNMTGEIRIVEINWDCEYPLNTLFPQNYKNNRMQK